MGIFDNIIGSLTGDTAKKTAEENKQLIQGNLEKGTGYLQGGQTNALSALDQAAGAYGGLSDLAKKYGGATSLNLDALGVNGDAGKARALGAFRGSDPGYDYRVSQSLDQLKRAAAASGMDVGGNALAALSDRAGNMADQSYQQWVNNLNGFVSPELQATGAAAQGVGNAYTNKAGVYTGTANSLANLGTQSTNSLVSNNNQEANAKMQAGSNSINLLSNVAKLGTAFL